MYAKHTKHKQDENVVHTRFQFFILNIRIRFSTFAYMHQLIKIKHRSIHVSINKDKAQIDTCIY